MKTAGIAAIGLMMSVSLYAQDVQIVGTVTQDLKIPQAAAQQQEQNNSSMTKAPFSVKLLKVKLTDNAKANLKAQAKDSLEHKTHLYQHNGNKLPEQIELGMNDVPVLNQGMHGSCVTFATTAAIDASIGNGDYVSQLCSLQLGNYLERYGYGVSGWNGSWARFVLSQIDSFGLVNKEYEATEGCGGLTEYPVYEEGTPDSAITLEDYSKMSEALNSYGIMWSPIQDFIVSFTERTNTDKTLYAVKKSLLAGDRVTIGTLLAAVDLGTAGAVGNHHAKNDSWVLTPEIARDVLVNPDLVAGHEMVIIGYDDKAVSVDDQGRSHRGMLHLRNSWSERAGDNGDFYMSYDYFRMFVIEVNRIHGPSYWITKKKA